MSESTRAIRIEHTGGPDVMQISQQPLHGPSENELQIRHTAIGLNFIDIYHRTGLYPLPLPSGLGLEAAGVVEKTGATVTDFKVGDRVAYGAGPIGAYSVSRNIPANRVSKLPDGIDEETAAAMMLKGMTASYLLRQTYKVNAGESILIHAAAGGVGLIACQWAKALGAVVIGTVGSDEKAQVAKSFGCDHIINYSHENIAEKVKEYTGGKGVPVVYDGVGKATLDASLDSLRARGLLVSYGNASGPIKEFDLGRLSAKGSLYITRPTLMTYVADDVDLQQTARDLFEIVESGKVKIPIHQRFPLDDVRQAHKDLESRKTTGSTLLIP